NTIKIYLNGEEIITQADSEGTFGVEKLSLDPGSNEIIALALNEFDNESEASAPLTVEFDNQVPTLELESPSDGMTVEEATVEVKGKTELGARVWVNERLVIVDQGEQESSFSTSISLKEGGNQITVVAKDSAENQTKKVVTVTYLP
ncbi:MAG: hypothetical protein ABID04_02775, partial [Patescibacteria group bacterium]